MGNKGALFVFGGTFAIAAILAAMAAPGSSAFAQSDPNAGVAAAVQAYFGDIPVMIAIAKCESGPRQFAANGYPLYAGTGGVMVGVFQIDSTIHTVPARALGFDITTLAGNMGYARYLYGAEGTDPWISSFPCWSYAAASASAGGSTATSSSSSSGSTTTITTGATSTVTTTPALTLNLSLGEIDPQVLILQQLLNQAGFTLAASGPGSPGNETNKFGALTYAALKQFQCAKGIACSGDESTTGYGYLNAATRAALLAATAAPAQTSQSTSTTSSATTTVIVATSTTISTPDNSAEVSSLQSRIAALVIIVQQLEAELAAKV